MVGEAGLAEGGYKHLAIVAPPKLAENGSSDECGPTYRSSAYKDGYPPL